MGRRLIPFVACALLLTGCGVKSHKAAPVGTAYKLGPTAKCLRAHHFKVSTREQDVNFIAYSAPGGGLRARKKGTDLIIAFGQSGKDRRQILIAVKRFARKSAIFRYRLGRANVVLLWAYRPSKKNKALVERCLTGS